jgi:hypothetical protein
MAEGLRTEAHGRAVCYTRTFSRRWEEKGWHGRTGKRVAGCYYNTVTTVTLSYSAPSRKQSSSPYQGRSLACPFADPFGDSGQGSGLRLGTGAGAWEGGVQGARGKMFTIALRAAGARPSPGLYPGQGAGLAYSPGPGSPPSGEELGEGKSVQRPRSPLTPTFSPLGRDSRTRPGADRAGF